MVGKSVNDNIKALLNSLPININWKIICGEKPALSDLTLSYSLN